MGERSMGRDEFGLQAECGSVDFPWNLSYRVNEMS